MLFKFNGLFQPMDLERIIQPLMTLIAAERVDGIDEVSLSLRAWREGKRVQLVNRRGFIVTPKIEALPTIDRAGPTKFVLPPEWKFRDRPDELDNEAFAIFTGLDD